MIIPPARTVDKWGRGDYLAPRERNGVKDQHKGVDFAVYPDSVILAPCDCVIERIGLPYSDKKRSNYKLMVLRVDQQTVIKIMYIWPIVSARSFIKKWKPIGLSQDLTLIYDGITNHYHLEVIIEGQHVNPKLWLYKRGMI